MGTSLQPPISDLGSGNSVKENALTLGCTTKIEIVPPADYEAIKRDLQKLKAQNRKLKKILAFGQISSLSQLIDQYIDFSSGQLKKIANEVQLADYARDNIDKVLSLIDHLNYVQLEMREFISVYTQGELLMKPRLQECVTKANAIVIQLEQLGSLGELDDKKAIELRDMLHTFGHMMETFIDSTKGVRP